MILRALVLALLMPVAAMAQEGVELSIAPNPNVDSGPPVVTAPGALLRALDKSVGRATDIEILTGQTVVLGRIAVRLLECRYPEGSPGSEAFAHLEITDLEGQGLFDGWMIASSPALSALEHPRYDVWVLRCSTSSGGTDEG
mgnify:CR=1 FL=1